MGLSSFFRFAAFDVECAVSSHLYVPKILLGTRVVGTTYLSAVLIGALITTPSLRYFISFFTNISFCALLIYYLWSLAWSFQYCRLSENRRELWAKQKNPVAGYIYWVLYGSLAVFHIIVPLVYWTLLRAHQKPHTGLYAWATISEHSSDGVFMILEIVSTRMPMSIRHLPFSLVFMLLYLLTTFVNYWTTNTWVYSFQDYDTQGWKKTGMYYAGVAVVLVVIYVLVWKVHELKEYLAKRRMEKIGRSAEDEGEENEGFEDEKKRQQLQSVYIE